MKLDTTYLGLPLKHPMIAGASPLPDDLDKVRELEDAGIAAITMYSLFEEQITHNLIGAEAHIGSYENSFAEAVSYFPESGLLERGVEAYLGQLQKVKAAVGIPVIASLNGSREGNWVDYAGLIESAGADALELNLYFLPAQLEESAAAVEDRCKRIVQAVADQVS
ncbi:MAG: dihydroorotate dehydrogenase-like protein, partial [Verrucomicrobiota bacterium]